MSVRKAFESVRNNGACTHGVCTYMGSRVLNKGTFALVAECKSKWGVYYLVYYASEKCMREEAFDTLEEAERLFAEVSE